ncbi:helix-turn-helix domain-containing protein [Tropicimonas isoalkanivorans]|uniref:Transcriptional regulator, contains XRE-family HTH domain n=1 Tax=Tropicimonas isoalkanivorans TaxID=441112 RepID=A0A1I1FUS4_9RHOB|nr:helix-turn-helix transcriptional regulator [Tropicimonas isoalkanivorans]SFC03074.1 Transcriptional regulator, contains XRE-family HTH domain [Tropicimonas isoalkanivorans]
MPTSPSLFARKLREWRAANGEHGRMTQEELAERLDVSLDAISKYERSVSFIRGDLEPRLADRLGWRREDILACRQDWEDRRQTAPQARERYRLLDRQVLEDSFGGSQAKAIENALVMARAEFADIPEAMQPQPRLWTEVYLRFPDHWAAVVWQNQIVAKWALPFLCPEDEVRFRDGGLEEETLSADRLHRPLLPGSYFGYSPAVVVLPGHEAASTLQLSSFVRFLEDLASRDVVLHGIGAISVSLGGGRLCRDLGMTRLGSYRIYPSFDVWELPGRVVPMSIFGRRSARLATRYAQAFGGPEA